MLNPELITYIKSPEVKQLYDNPTQTVLYADSFIPNEGIMTKLKKLLGDDEGFAVKKAMLGKMHDSVMQAEANVTPGKIQRLYSLVSHALPENDAGRGSIKTFLEKLPEPKQVLNEQQLLEELPKLFALGRRR